MAGLGASHFAIPRIIAYVFVGILFSQDLLGGILQLELGQMSEVATSGALGIIAYIIGGSITINQFRRIGKVIFSTATGETLGALITVFTGLILVLPELDGINNVQLSLALAAIAVTTAPAATLAVLHQYRASGPLTDSLLGVVAVDDAIGIIFYSLAIALATGATLSSHMGTALWEISGSVSTGIALGYFTAKLGHRVRQSGLRLALILGAIFLMIGIAESLDLSAVLGAMALGFSSRHFLQGSAERLFAPIELLEELVFLVFFTLAGAHFQLHVITANIDIILVYFFARMAGKLIGASTGAKLAGAPNNISRWIGFGLVPQAGLAVGLALTLSHDAQFQSIAPMIVNVILGTTLLYELIGPFAVHMALSRCNELGTKRSRVHE